MRRKRKYELKKSRKLIYGLIAVAVVFLGLLSCYFLFSPNQTNVNRGFSYKAAIVDHLSLTAPNQTFIQIATAILENAGFAVDYYKGEEVNVEFYRDLPTHGYGLIVLRVHSSLKEGKYSPLCLFTSEPYSKYGHLLEQLTDKVVGVSYTLEDYKRGEVYFGIFPKFIQQDMKGTFQNATIMMMGCNGLTYTDMAQAFIEKGAKVYISWDWYISASHTDQATTELLTHLITEKQTIKQAVTETMKEVGPDPEFGSVLVYYPNTLVDNYMIPIIASNLILNDATVSGYDSQSSLRHVHCHRYENAGGTGLEPATTSFLLQLRRLTPTIAGLFVPYPG